VRSNFSWRRAGPHCTLRARAKPSCAVEQLIVQSSYELLRCPTDDSQQRQLSCIKAAAAEWLPPMPLVASPVELQSNTFSAIRRIRPDDMPAGHDLCTATRHHITQRGPGQWFLDSAEFDAWQQGRDKTLFCPGISGTGKTMMAAVAVDHLCKRARSEDIGVT
jgi:DNA replication protein DnaC